MKTLNNFYFRNKKVFIGVGLYKIKGDIMVRTYGLVYSVFNTIKFKNLFLTQEMIENGKNN